MLDKARVAAAIPVQDIERAKSFYADKLGLKPTIEDPAGCMYESEGGRFGLFPSMGKASGDHTQLMFEVADIEAAVKQLRGNGVVFEEYDMPGFKSVDGIVDMGPGGRGAWFKDSEGNVLGLGEWTPEA